ncbi:ferritin-like domain-containing protein [Formosa sp. A9]|uniref:YciE/YciF ferroxidase family protein n=1 Tax=Formosa sp. A9 TaxID=3442641 RepID=UPI003EB92855
MNHLKDLFLHSIQDIYSAEQQLIESTPELLDYASDCGIKRTFKTLLHDVKKHKHRIEAVCKSLHIHPTGRVCESIKGLISDTQNLVATVKDRNILDAGLIANALRAVHYEIAAYTVLVRYAQELLYSGAAATFQDSLDEAELAVHALDSLSAYRLDQRVIAV